ncbi:MAG: AzlD domain-containing protein [Oscillospiraceae bacterium]|nr:AzlD domain-containing protein [Oscillospiraceae bacterium]MBQ6493061.1 AzlD domain-containing protein [Erysipelotrichaceae bacterium]
MRNNIYIYIAVMTITVFLVRVLPLTIIRRPITNRFIRDFLYYVPYVTLSVMTFPAIINATENPLAGAAALIFGIIAAYRGMGLFKVTVICCLCVLIIEYFL